jgi:hypothetical protein
VTAETSVLKTLLVDRVKRGLWRWPGLSDWVNHRHLGASQREELFGFWFLLASQGAICTWDDTESRTREDGMERAETRTSWGLCIIEYGVVFERVTLFARNDCIIN